MEAVGIVGVIAVLLFVVYLVLRVAKARASQRPDVVREWARRNGYTVSSFDRRTREQHSISMEEEGSKVFEVTVGREQAKK